LPLPVIRKQRLQPAPFGGGGFLLAHPDGQDPEVYDFFVQTPAEGRSAEELDFYPIDADFGTATQEFHIGIGSVAVPGVIAGLFEIHRHRCRLPLDVITEPARLLARDGVCVNAFQHYINRILEPIIKASPDASRLTATDERPGLLADEGERVYHREMADALEALVREGPGLFYHGEMGKVLVADCASQGGLITMQDLAAYRVRRRQPIRISLSGASLEINSPPSPGGCLVAFALALIQSASGQLGAWGSRHHCDTLLGGINAARYVRHEHAHGAGLDDGAEVEILGEENLARWRASMGAPLAHRGTTHLSVADAEGNVASLTVSNGEGSAYVLPGTGIMLNNMLGEEDLSPGGFHAWPRSERMASMMSPAVLTLPDGGQIALGSGGSNRIRSALLQVMVNLLDFDMTLDQAVTAPRLHLEHDHFSIEQGFPAEVIEQLCQQWPDHHVWPPGNLFFGGVHAVHRLADGTFQGAGDPRRGGAISRAGL
jgi:gamma-glutamyltranspeptidase/glutathione hydrolase